MQVMHSIISLAFKPYVAKEKTLSFQFYHWTQSLSIQNQKKRLKIKHLQLLPQIDGFKEIEEVIFFFQPLLFSHLSAGKRQLGGKEMGLYYSETHMPQENQKILGPLMRLTFSYFRFVLMNGIPDVCLPFLYMNIVMKKYNILV